MSAKREARKTIEIRKTIHQSGQPSPEAKPRVIVAIPCFNNRRSIGDIVSRAQRHVEQVIVIDDGSDDGSDKVAQEAGAVVINHGTNRGYGEATRSCFEAAKVNGADVLVILDGDGQHYPENLPQVIAPLLTGNTDMVIGSRFITNENNMPKYRRFGIGVISFLWNFGSRVKVSDTQSGFRGYYSKMFQNLCLTEEGMSVSIEILEKARKRGAIIKEVPISCFYAPSRLNAKAIKHGLCVALSVIRIRIKSSMCSLLRGRRV